MAVPGLEECIRSGEGNRLAASASALADSLQLAVNSVSALVENRTLVRRFKAENFSELWKNGP